MQNYLLKAGSLTENTAGKGDKLASANVFKLERHNGWIIVVFEAVKNADELFIVQNIILEQAQRSASTFAASQNIQHRFEQLLEAINEQIASAFAEGQFEESPESVNCLIAVATANRMFISGTGTMEAVFLHKEQNGRYQIYNLFRSIQTERTRASWQKLFSTVLDGDLHNSDVFYVATSELESYIRADEVNEIATSLPAASSPEKIRQYLPHISHVGYAVLKVEERVSSMDGEDVYETAKKTRNILQDQSFSLRSAKRAVPITRELLKVLIASVIVAVSIIFGLTKFLFATTKKILKIIRRI